MSHSPHPWIGTAITLAIVGLILLLRLRHVGQERPLKLERLWVVPAIYGAIALYAFWRVPPHGATWLYCVAALAVGATLGWYRGRMIAIRVDPATHALNQTTSPAAMLFILAVVLLRLGARGLAVEMNLGNAALLILTDILIAFALGFLPVTRMEMAMRARRLLREARAA